MNKLTIDKNDLRQILKRLYKHDRFEGRDNQMWGLDYSECVVNSRMQDLEKFGVTYVSRHETASGRPLKILADGQIIAL